MLRAFDEHAAEQIAIAAQGQGVKLIADGGECLSQNGQQCLAAAGKVWKGMQRVELAALAVFGLIIPRILRINEEAEVLTKLA